MGALTYNEVIWDALDRTYGQLRFAAERLARDARATPKAARNWLERQNAPNGSSLIELMAINKELRESVLRLVEERERERGKDRR